MILGTEGRRLGCSNEALFHLQYEQCHLMKEVMTPVLASE